MFETVARTKTVPPQNGHRNLAFEADCSCYLRVPEIRRALGPRRVRSRVELLLNRFSLILSSPGGPGERNRCAGAVSEPARSRPGAVSEPSRSRPGAGPEPGAKPSTSAGGSRKRFEFPDASGATLGSLWGAIGKVFG